MSVFRRINFWLACKLQLKLRESVCTYTVSVLHHKFLNIHKAHKTKDLIAKQWLCKCILSFGTKFPCRFQREMTKYWVGGSRDTPSRIMWPGLGVFSLCFPELPRLGSWVKFFVHSNIFGFFCNLYWNKSVVDVIRINKQFSTGMQQKVVLREFL